MASMRHSLRLQTQIFEKALYEHHEASDNGKKTMIEAHKMEVKQLKNVIVEKDARIEDLEKRLADQLTQNASLSSTFAAESSAVTLDHGLIRQWKAVYVPGEKSWKCPVCFSVVTGGLDAGFDDGNCGRESEGEGDEDDEGGWEDVGEDFDVEAVVDGDGDDDEKSSEQDDEEDAQEENDDEDHGVIVIGYCGEVAVVNDGSNGAVNNKQGPEPKRCCICELSYGDRY